MGPRGEPGQPGPKVTSSRFVFVHSDVILSLLHTCFYLLGREILEDLALTILDQEEIQYET